MKHSMRKDAFGNGVGVVGVGGGGAAASPVPTSLPLSLSLSCFDIKPLVATLLGFSLLMALWHFQPYDSLLLFSHSSTSIPSVNPSSSSSSSSCPTIFTATFKPSNSSNSSSSSSSSSISTKLPLPLPLPLPRKDPNVRVFRPYGSAAALFVQMGAYRGGPYTFAVVGLASKPAHVFGKPWFKCEWAPNSSPNSTVRAKAYKMLPDWGYGRVYTVVVVNCTFPVVPNADNAGGKLLLHAYYSPSLKRYEKFVALEEPPGSYDASRFLPPYEFDYLYCGSSLYGDREMLERAFRWPWRVRRVLGTPSSAAFWHHPTLPRFAISHCLLRSDTVAGLALKYSVQSMIRLSQDWAPGSVGEGSDSGGGGEAAVPADSGGVFRISLILCKRCW